MKFFNMFRRKQPVNISRMNEVSDEVAIRMKREGFTGFLLLGNIDANDAQWRSVVSQSEFCLNWLVKHAVFSIAQMLVNFGIQPIRVRLMLLEAVNDALPPQSQSQPHLVPAQDN